jgi:cytidylate kinase
MAKVGSDRYGALAERQAARWEQAQRAQERRKHVPAVVISRLPGSGGEEVGHLVAQKLDFGFFGREIVEEVAKELGIDHWLVRGLDEHRSNVIERSLSELFGRSGVDEDRFQRNVVRAVTTLGKRGSVVIVGRGSAYLLSEHDALRVLLAAPRAFRVDRYAQTQNIPSERAESELTVAERQRIDFTRRQFGVDQTDPALYDLVVNTQTLGFAGAAELIVDAYHKRFPG